MIHSPQTSWIGSFEFPRGTSTDPIRAELAAYQTGDQKEMFNFIIENELLGYGVYTGEMLGPYGVFDFPTSPVQENDHQVVVDAEGKIQFWLS